MNFIRTTGDVHVANAEQVERLDNSFAAIIEHAGQLGPGSHDMLFGPPQVG